MCVDTHTFELLSTRRALKVIFETITALLKGCTSKETRTLLVSSVLQYTVPVLIHYMVRSSFTKPYSLFTVEIYELHSANVAMGLFSVPLEISNMVTLPLCLLTLYLVSMQVQFYSRPPCCE